MKPTIGRIVIVVASQCSNNGADRAPGIITRAFGQTGAEDTRDGPVNVNVTCLPDTGTHIQAIGSVPLYDTEADAQDARDMGLPYAFWPERA